MSYGLGVDLGTTFTGVAVSAHGQTRIVTFGDSSPAVPVVAPQAVGDLIRGGDLLVRAGVGAEAEAGLGIGVRTGTEVVRPSHETGLVEPVPLALGGRPPRSVPVLAGVLRSVLDAVTTAEGEAPEKVVLTCPAVWGPVRRRQFAEVSRQAGLNSVAVVSEAEAATAFFARSGRLVEGDVVAVYDLGAVTVDLTVVRVTESGTEILGQPEALEGVGGIDFDNVLLAHIDGLVNGVISRLDVNHPASAALLAGVRAECVRAKEALSWAESTTVAVGFGAQEVRVGLNRVEFEAMIRGGLESTLIGLRRSMLSAGVGIADLAGVVLVGGSSRIPLVERILRNGLGRPLLVPDYPQHCVVLGAAAVAEGSPLRPRPAEPLAGSPSGSGSASASGSKPGSEPRSRREDRPRDRRRLLALTVTTVLLLAWGAYFAAAPLFRDSPTNARADRPTGPSEATAAAAAPSSVPVARVTPRTVRIRKATPAPVVPPAPVAATGTGALTGRTGKCLDVQGAQSTDGTPVQLFTCNKTNAQIWTAGRDGSLRALGKCLQSTGARLVINSCTGAAAQRWRVISGGIRKARSKQCVAVLGTPNDLASVGLVACRAQPAQRWKLLS